MMTRGEEVAGKSTEEAKEEEEEDEVVKQSGELRVRV